MAVLLRTPVTNARLNTDWRLESSARNESIVIDHRTDDFRRIATRHHVRTGYQEIVQSQAVLPLFIESIFVSFRSAHAEEE
jgi:hypothetical protein